MMLKFSFCVVGIYVCFLSWAVLQERLTSVKYLSKHQTHEKFRYFVFLNFFQSLVASLIAFVVLYVRGTVIHYNNGKLILEYMRVALSSSLASPFGYASLKHISYPTMILGKSCKLLPVMLMNVILHKRSFAMYKYVSVALITLGVSGFMLFDKEGKDSGRSNSLYGIFLLMMNLLIDGATNSWQDKIFGKYKVKSLEMMFFMNGFSAIYMVTYLLIPGLSSELREAIYFVSEYPLVWKDIILFALMGALGQTFIFYTLEQFGSLSLVMVTVTRKLFTILISLLWFDHHIRIHQWAFVSLVFSGILVESFYGKYTGKPHTHTVDAHSKKEKKVN